MILFVYKLLGSGERNLENYVWYWVMFGLFFVSVIFFKVGFLNVGCGKEGGWFCLWNVISVIYGIVFFF